MSFIKASGIISDHLGTAPVAGIGLPLGGIPMGGNATMGFGPLGFGAIRPAGSLGGLMPVSFDSKTRSVLHPAGMPIATTLNPFNPFDTNSTIVSNPFGGLSGMTGLTGANFGLGNLGINNVQEIYKRNGVDVIISGCNTDVKKVIECLDSHLLLLTSPPSTVSKALALAKSLPVVAPAAVTPAGPVPAPAPAPVAAPAPAGQAPMAQIINN